MAKEYRLLKKSWYGNKIIRIVNYKQQLYLCTDVKDLGYFKK